jgi:hypothetical protein
MFLRIKCPACGKSTWKANLGTHMLIRDKEHIKMGLVFLEWDAKMWWRSFAVLALLILFLTGILYLNTEATRNLLLFFSIAIVFFIALANLEEYSMLTYIERKLEQTK